MLVSEFPVTSNCPVALAVRGTPLTCTVYWPANPNVLVAVGIIVPACAADKPVKIRAEGTKRIVQTYSTSWHVIVYTLLFSSELLQELGVPTSRMKTHSNDLNPAVSANMFSEEPPGFHRQQSGNISPEPAARSRV